MATGAEKQSITPPSKSGNLRAGADAGVGGVAGTDALGDVLCDALGGPTPVDVSDTLGDARGDALGDVLGDALGGPTLVGTVGTPSGPDSGGSATSAPGEAPAALGAGTGVIDVGKTSVRTGPGVSTAESSCDRSSPEADEEGVRLVATGAEKQSIMPPSKSGNLRAGADAGVGGVGDRLGYAHSDARGDELGDALCDALGGPTPVGVGDTL